MTTPKHQPSADRSAGAGAGEEWTTDEVLGWLAEQGRVIKPSTWYAYVSRGQAPPPRRMVGRTPVWDPAAIRTFHAQATRGSGRRASPSEEQ